MEFQYIREGRREGREGREEPEEERERRKRRRGESIEEVRGTISVHSVEGNGLNKVKGRDGLGRGGEGGGREERGG